MSSATLKKTTVDNESIVSIKIKKTPHNIQLSDENSLRGLRVIIPEKKMYNIKEKVKNSY